MQQIPSKKTRVSQKRLIHLLKNHIELEKIKKLEEIFELDSEPVLTFLQDLREKTKDLKGNVYFQKKIPFKLKGKNFSTNGKRLNWGFESKHLYNVAYPIETSGNRQFYCLNIKRVIEFHISRIELFYKKQNNKSNNIFDKNIFHTNIFYMKKRSGGHRKIYVPSQDLRKEQTKIKEILDHLLSSIEKKFDLKFSFAYKLNKSIKDNVTPHQQSKFFLKIDLQDFFDSISPEHLYFLKIDPAYKNLLTDPAYENLLTQAEDFCFFHRRAVQGYVTSPTISNLIMVNFDLKMKELVTDQNFLRELVLDQHHKNLQLLSTMPLEKQGQLLDSIKKSLLTLNSLEASAGVKLIYTRYSDDITVSFENDFGQSEKIYEYIINHVQKSIAEINDIQKHGEIYQRKIKINQKKIRKLSLKDGAVTITGVRIIPSENGNILAPSKRVIQETEFLINLSNKFKLSREKINKLKGLLSFIKQISEAEWRKLIYKCKPHTRALLKISKTECKNINLIKTKPD